jgi:hypothetical protein
MFINPGLAVLFHGCDEKVRNKIVKSSTEHLHPSGAQWEWLGDGIYFWENSYEKALEWANHIKNNPMPNISNPITKPSVLGAIVDFKNCLDFLDAKYLKLLKVSYEMIKDSPKLPKNTGTTEDLTIRKLDYYVVQNIHKFTEQNQQPKFDSVRSVFWEGDKPYPDAGFRDKNHIQVCIRTKECIKGYFIPRV